MWKLWIGTAGLIFTCLLFVPTVASAQAIGGTVADSTGGVLPGVTVEVRSPVLIEQVRTAITDGSGIYLITGLVSGEYSVTFTLPGFSVVVREGIVLSAGFTANVDAQLSVGSVEETITVTGASPIVDVQSVSQNANIDREIIDAVPSGKSFQNLGVLVPGMLGDGVVGSTASTDVGGQQGVSYMRLAIHGGAGSDQQVQVDGLGVEAATRGGDSSNVFFADGNFAEYSIDYSANPAEVETGGVRVNMIPREGSNDFSGSFFTNFSFQDLQSDNIDQDLIDRGLEEGSGSRMKEIWMYNPTLGGPIARDRLWFFFSHTQSRVDNFVANLFLSRDPSLPFFNQGDIPAIDDQLLRSNSLRLTWQATSRNKVTFYWDRNHNKRDNFLTGSTLNPSILNSAESSVDSTIDVSIYQVTWTAPLTNRLLLEAGYSHHPQQQLWALHELADRTHPGAIDARGNAVAIRNFSGWFSGTTLQDRLANTNSARASLSYVTGSHAFKVGFTATMVDEDIRATSDFYESHAFTNVNVFGFNVNQASFYTTPNSEINEVSPNLGIYAQDQWTIDRLTVNAGVRFDYFRSSFPDHTVLPSRWVSETRNFAGQATSGFKDLQPRLGVSYDLFGDGRTALKASASRYADRDSNSRAGAINPAGTNTTQTRVWLDFNQNGEVDGDPTNPAMNGELFTPSDNLAWGTPIVNTFYDEDWAFGWGTRHSNWEFSGSVQHELVSNVSVNVGYFRRNFVNFSAQQNRAVMSDDFAQYSVTVPVDPRLPGGGGNVLTGYYDLDPSKLGQIDNITTSADDFGGRSQTWNGMDFNVDARLDDLLLSGGISTGKASNDRCELISNLPETGLLVGQFCQNDEPFLTQFKLLGSYTLPYEVQIAGTFQSIPGPAREADVRFSAAQTTLGRPFSSGSTKTINVVEPGTEYGERLNQFDLRFTKLFTFGQTRLQASFDLYNVLNANTVTVEDLSFGPSYLAPTAIMPGRLGKFAFQFSF